MHLKLLQKELSKKLFFTANDDFIGSKIDDEITKAWKRSTQSSSEAVESETKIQNLIEKYQKKDIYLQKIINDLRLMKI